MTVFTKTNFDIMELGLLNWTPDKGNPYEYSAFNTKATYMLFENQINIGEKLKLQKMKEKLKIKFNHSLALLATLNLEQTALIFGVYKGDGFTFLEKKELNCEKEVSVVLDYPFEKMAKVIVNPLLIKYENDSRYESNIGYYAYQIAKAYEEIYKNAWKEIGVWGHGFGDLYLEGISVMNDNQLLVSIGS